MSIEIKMPALSPTMEEGTLARWLVKEGDSVRSGDVLAEIETDKATMEFEAIDEGVVEKLLVAEGADGVKVGTTIAVISGEDDGAVAIRSAHEPEAGADAGADAKADTGADTGADAPAERAQRATGSDNPPAAEKGHGAGPERDPAPAGTRRGAEKPAGGGEGRVKASPLARRLAEQQGVDLAGVTGSGPNGRIVKADIDGAGDAKPAAPVAAEAPKPVATAKPASVAAPAAAAPPEGVPVGTAKLSNMRKVIARRLTESKQQVPHIYLTVDIRLDALLALRGQLNAGLESRGIKLSVNDLLVKAQAMALMEVPAVNVQFGGDVLHSFGRADISVAVSIPGGLITPVVTGADAKSVSAIAAEIKDLAGRAREGKLQPHEYQGGTASLSNMGMYGIRQFEAVINPPQGMILAIGAGEKRPYVEGDALIVATVMSATGSFDHRAIDGADGAAFMAAFKRLVENPLGMLA